MPQIGTIPSKSTMVRAFYLNLKHYYSLEINNLNLLHLVIIGTISVNPEILADPKRLHPSFLPPDYSPIQFPYL